MKDKLLKEEIQKEKTPSEILRELEDLMITNYQPKIVLLYICLYQCAKIKRMGRKSFLLTIGDYEVLINYDSKVYEQVRYAYYVMGVRENGKQV